MKLEQAAREVIRQHSMECLSDKTVDALREALDHIADSDKMVTTSKVTLPKQGKCECGDKCFPIFSGNSEYCETCGWPIVSGEDHNPNKVDEKALLEALAKQARHLNVEPVKIFTSDDIKVAFENGYAAAMSVADIAKETEQEPVAWAYIDADGSFMDALGKQHGAYQTPVYTHPVRTKDLTDDEIDEIGKSYFDEWSFGFARAVIAADREKNK